MYITNSVPKKGKLAQNELTYSLTYFLLTNRKFGILQDFLPTRSWTALQKAIKCGDLGSNLLFPTNSNRIPYEPTSFSLRIHPEFHTKKCRFQALFILISRSSKHISLIFSVLQITDTAKFHAQIFFREFRATLADESKS